MRGLAALVDGLQALHLYVLLEQAAQLAQPVRDAPHQAEHAPQVTVLVRVQQFLVENIRNL